MGTAPAPGFDAADDGGGVGVIGHEVDYGDIAMLRLEHRLQDHRITAVTPLDTSYVASWGN